MAIIGDLCKDTYTKYTSAVTVGFGMGKGRSSLQNDATGQNTVACYIHIDLRSDLLTVRGGTSLLHKGGFDALMFSLFSVLRSSGPCATMPRHSCSQPTIAGEIGRVSRLSNLARACLVANKNNISSPHEIRNSVIRIQGVKISEPSISHIKKETG